ncbi:hypothetical protein BLA29_014253 [Euroglyphus maynei]|uniref:Uncharacterized protein n=1 Tax=Euroglyphus maynei TaxID=6958 RepID=A0A1Y3B3A0_EURMA|nr:hypothetical protein BLA29_014253 [Euroglyphus maynei]
MFRTKLLIIILNLLAIGHYSEQFDCMNYDGNNDNDNDECLERPQISTNNDESNINNNKMIHVKLANYGQSLNYIDENYSNRNAMLIEIFRHKDGEQIK